MSLQKEKLNDLILYLGQSPHVPELGKTKLWKLLYFIDAGWLREHGETLTGSEYIKYDHGPVPSRGDKQLKKLEKEGRLRVSLENHGSYTQHHLTTIEEVDPLFSPEERSFIDQICQKFGRKTASYLSQISHDEPAWVYAKPLDKLSPTLMAYGAQEDPEGL